MWRVLPTLLLGTADDASENARLRAAAVTHVVNCAKELPSYCDDDFIYTRLELGDPDPRFGSCIKEVCGFIDAGRDSGVVFVYCHGAISRSPSVILAYLCHLGATIEDAAKDLAAVCQTRPNDLFLDQLSQHYRGCGLTEGERDKILEVLAGGVGR